MERQGKEERKGGKREGGLESIGCLTYFVTRTTSPSNGATSCEGKQLPKEHETMQTER